MRSRRAARRDEACTPPAWARLKAMNKLALAIATWFGCGYSPWAPGTVGSAGGVLVGWLLVRYARWPPWTLAVLAAAATPVGIWAAGRTADLVGKKDPGLVVVDEVLGQWIALAALTAWSWPWALVAFALFRLFDIVKPWPVWKLERLAGGTGIVLDDLGAGVYAWVTLRVLQLAAGWFNLK
jgi:phosphatidylglycerophosphatase A